MKLRARLLASSVAQLLVVGLLITVGYYESRATILPMLEESLRRKAESTLSALTSELDVALGAGDAALIERSVADVIRDPDFRFIEIRDENKVVRYRSGSASDEPALSGTARIAHEHGDTVRAWMTVSLEGVVLGTVALIYDTGRVDHLRAWIQGIGVIALAVWLAILIYSVAFSRAFVRPIRGMMEFTRRIAGGDLGGKLDGKAPGELAELSEYLNQMSMDLASREVEKHRASAKEAELQRELMSVSRMAGMAEVATGVLHNVGNVLNSLNVSVSLVGDRLRQSKVASLTRTVELFEQHPDGLVGFLATDKGKLIPKFLVSVSQRLAEENAHVRAELEAVAENVDHIRTIVSTQQSYARVAGISEPVEIGALIDDALHMSEASFARHQVELVKQYDHVPTLNTDRHKLLQIVINLISNARHALKAQGPAGTLNVRIDRRDKMVAIVVADTGIGISAENLGRVFQHGFTTKKGGHGFGLHSCANAARELGGSISVASEGAGRGATFTLEIPIEAPGRTHDLRN